MAARILLDHGADAETVRNEVIRWALGTATLGAGILIGWAI